MENPEANKANNKLAGIFYGGLAFTLWGFLPIYWKLLKRVSAQEILAHRIIWSFIFVGLLLVIFKPFGNFISALTTVKTLMLMSICSLLISTNWFTYIWAINAGHIIETSMGYYINPLIAVLLGMTVLKEKLNIYQYISLILAFIGVLLVTVQYGKIPWVALILAVSFALYGLCKKLIAVESMTGLALETAILSPFALIFVIFGQVKGTGSFGNTSLLTALLLAGAGAVTATPLLLFAKGAKRVELSTIGFLQYISPTISLVLGIFMFKEKFTGIDLISFGIIWTALVIYSISQTILLKSRVRESQTVQTDT